MLKTVTDVQTGVQSTVEMSAEEIQELATIRSEHVFTYAQKRLAEYPTIADYIDGVVKGDQAQINKYIADCLAVKAKYPKP